MFVHSGESPLILRTAGSPGSLTGTRRPGDMYHDYRCILIGNQSVDKRMRQSTVAAQVVAECEGCDRLTGIPLDASSRRGFLLPPGPIQFHHLSLLIPGKDTAPQGTGRPQTDRGQQQQAQRQSSFDSPEPLHRLPSPSSRGTGATTIRSTSSESWTTPTAMASSAQKSLNLSGKW